MGVVASLSRTMACVAEQMSVLTISVNDAVGYCSFSRASMPVTRGAAKLVPDLVVLPVGAFCGTVYEVGR